MNVNAQWRELGVQTHTHTHARAHTHTCTHRLMQLHAHTCVFIEYVHNLRKWHTQIQTHSLTHSLTHTHTIGSTLAEGHTQSCTGWQTHTHTHTPSCYLIRDHTDGGYVVRVMQPARGSAKAHVSVEMERWMTRPLSSSVLFRALSFLRLFLFIYSRLFLSSLGVSFLLLLFSNQAFLFLPPSYLTHLHFTWYQYIYLFIYLFCFISTFTVLVILVICLGNNARNGSSCLHQAFIQSVGICFSSISIFGFRMKLKK